jgi:hypothetical protein
MEIKTSWNTAQCAQRIGSSRGALEVGRMRGTIDIPYIRMGKKKIVYDPEVVEQWLRDHTVVPGQPKAEAPRAKRRYTKRAARK